MKKKLIIICEHRFAWTSITANSTEVEAFFPQLISFYCNFLNFFEGEHELMICSGPGNTAISHIHDFSVGV